MQGLFDYHIHTALSRHAEGSMEDYVRAACQAGLSEMGFSDHLPFPGEEDSKAWCMHTEEVAGYVAELRRLQRVYESRIRIWLACEADYVAGRLEATRRQVEAQSFDYVIGSVHTLGGWGMDNSEEMEGWKTRDVDQVWRDYFRALRASASCGLFDVIGHCDVAKKFGYLPKADMAAEMQETARAFAQAGVLIEINTSGLRKPCKEIYPSLQFLSLLGHHGVGATLGSDAHRPLDVAADFRAALELARAAGYRELFRFKAGGFRPESIG